MGLQFVVQLLIGGLLLWLGALLAHVPDVGFWKSFRANLRGTLLLLLVGVIAWALIGICFVAVGREALFAVPFPTLVQLSLAVLLGIGLMQFVVYVVSVRSSFSSSFVRTAGACLVAALLQGVFAAALSPVLGVAALSL